MADPNAPQFTDQGLSGLGMMGPNGQQQQFSMSWDQFNSIGADQQRQILAGMGLSNDQITQLQQDLQKTEIAQYGQYQQAQAHDAAVKAARSPVGNLGGPFGFVEDQLNQTMADLSGGHIGGKAVERLNPKSVAELQKESGFSGLLATLQNMSNTNAALGKVTPNEQASQQGGGALSPQALQSYLQNFVNPLIQQQQTAIAGDMSFWKDAINKVGGGYPGMADTMKEEIPMMQNMYQQLARENVTSQALSPYLNIVNNQIASAATVGEAARGLGSTYQNIAQAAQSNPAIANMLNTSGGVNGLNGAQSLQSLIGNIAQQGSAGAAATPRGAG